MDVSSQPPKQITTTTSVLISNCSTQVYHAYTYGTAFWYFLRGITRLLTPETVITWFRPPYQMVPHNGSSGPPRVMPQIPQHLE